MVWGRPRLDAPASPWYAVWVPNADPNLVLDSLTQFGGSLSMSEAAAKYGVKKGTIGYWAKERREGRMVALKVVPPPPPDPSRARGQGPIKVALERDRVLAAGLGDKLRNDYRDVFADLLTLAKQRTKAALDGPPLTEDGVPAADWTPPDMREVKAITDAIKNLAEQGSAILTFDSTTKPTADRDLLADPEAVRAEMARRRRA